MPQAKMRAAPSQDPEQQTPADKSTNEAPALKAAGVFWRNWRIWPTLLVAVLVIWIFGWMYMGALWGIEVTEQDRCKQHIPAQCQLIQSIVQHAQIKNAAVMGLMHILCYVT